MQISGTTVTREALVNNKDVLVHAINIVGSRVSVDVLSLHIRALYDLMKLEVPSTQTALSCAMQLFSSDVTVPPHAPAQVRPWMPKHGIFEDVSQSTTRSFDDHTFLESWRSDR